MVKYTVAVVLCDTDEHTEQIEARTAALQGAIGAAVQSLMGPDGAFADCTGAVDLDIAHATVPLSGAALG